MAQQPEEHDWKTVTAINSHIEWERKANLEAFDLLSGANFKKEDPLVPTSLPLEIVDDWNTYILLIPTFDAYDVHGSIDQKGRLKPTKKDKKWDIKKDYHIKMANFAMKHNVNYKDLQLLDLQMRVKRARGYKWALVKSVTQLYPKGRCSVFITDSAYYEEHKMGTDTENFQHRNAIFEFIGT
jgi:hypothetical protein